MTTLAESFLADLEDLSGSEPEDDDLQQPDEGDQEVGSLREQRGSQQPTPHGRSPLRRCPCRCWATSWTP